MPGSADVAGKFAASSWGKKLARQAAKKVATDFDRYKAAKAKVARSAAINAKLAK
jgi:large subunit ribosomal protein L14e